MLNRGIPTARAFVAFAAVVSALVAIALPATSSAGVRTTRMPRAAGHLTKVIVMLRDQPAGSEAPLGRTRNVLRAEEAPVVACFAPTGRRTSARARLFPS